MKNNRIKQWLSNHRIGLGVGLVFGALVAPFLATLGLVIPAFEQMRPLLISPMDLIADLIPNVQTGPDSYAAPLYKWILTLGFNGLCFAVLGGIVELLLKKLGRTSALNMFKTNKLASALFFAALLLQSACAMPSIPSTGASPDEDIVQPTSDIAIENMRTVLSRQLNVVPASIAVVQTEAVEWPDACLGLIDPVELCAPVATPGHKITFEINGEEYVLHTDSEAYRYRVAAAPEPEVGETVITWTGTSDFGDCMEANIGYHNLAFGMCSRPKIEGRYVSDARIATLDDWVSTFAAFEAETDFGSVQFLGTGSTVATPEEEQMIGRWGQMVTMEAAAGESRAGMSYHGPAEMGSPDTSKCTSLMIGASSEVGLGTCDDSLQTVELGERAYTEWRYLRDRFAPFTYETETEKVIFEGMGSLSGEQWQRAILAWSRARHAELFTGRTSATINTAMNWYLGQDYNQKNVCMQLTVLDYGFAYAKEFMCEGQDEISTVSDWLTSSEMALLDTWLYERAPLYVETNYVDGKGTQEMSEAETAELNAWTTELWSRLRASGVAVTPDSDSNSCPEPKDNLGTVRDYENGYCLLVPPDYTVFETSATEVAIVKGDLLNVTDPRLNIAVIPAEGRSAEAYSGEILAVITGIDIQTSAAEISGQPAVVIDNMPGQDINRRVIVAYSDSIYDLTFTPMSSAAIEDFYNTIINNFVLLELKT